jgi:hypothetical protein
MTTSAAWRSSPTWRASRVLHGTLAAVGGANILLQIVLTAGLASDSLGLRLLRLFSFFTVQSNVLVVIASATLALAPERDGRRWRVLRLTSLVAITVTGLVYLVVLRPIVHNEGLGILTDSVFHYVVPLVALVGWLAFGPRPRIRAHTVRWSLLFPGVWLVYTLLRGPLDRSGRPGGWYPYPFVDVGDLGYPHVLLNCIGVVLLLLVVAALFAAGDRRLPQRPLPPHPADAAHRRSASPEPTA